MFNIKSQLLVAAALVAGSFGITSSAFAGEGGVAGSASFQLNGTQVTSASVAVAVGKNTAYAGAATPSGTTGTGAFAAGTGGIISLGGSSIYITSISQSTAADPTLGTAQANNLNSNNVNINAITGTTTVTPQSGYYPYPF